MLNIQNKFTEYLVKLSDELSKLSLNNESKENLLLDIKQKIKRVENTELIIPVIGAFSAGKSTLLNSFLQKDYLEVDITPETALATELRYCEEEYIEAVNKDGQTVKYQISEKEEIKNAASNFRFLRFYINNPELKKIEPLTLVDMPGFDSPLDLHNQAIMEYLGRGAHYIVLTSIEDGTITRSMTRQLSDIKEYGRDFSFFLSKTNLRAASEAEQIAENIKQQIEDSFDISKNITMIDDNGGENLQKILSEIDPESLFKSLFLGELKELYFSIMEFINVSISTMEKSKSSNQETIKALKEALSDILEEKKRLEKDVTEKYSTTSINRIIESVGKDLSNSIDEIVSAAKSGQEAISGIISDIVRYSLLRSVKESMEEISTNIVDSFSTGLTKIDASMSEFTLSDGWLDKTSETIKNGLKNVQGRLGDMLDERRNNETDKTKIYKIITTILGLTTSVLNPILEVVIVFLPELLSWFTERYSQKKQQEQIRTTVLTEVIPKIKRELRAKLPEFFNEQVQTLIRDVASRFEGVIEEKRQIIENTQKDINYEIAEKAAVIASYRDILSSVNIISNETLYK